MTHVPKTSIIIMFISFLFFMIHTILEFLVKAIMAVGISVILIWFFKALIRFVRTEWKIAFKDRVVPHLSLVRHDLWVYLLLWLEFIIAGDIIETILNPELDHLMVLWWIVVIRIAISYFLGKEVGDVHEQIDIHENKLTKKK